MNRKRLALLLVVSSVFAAAQTGDRAEATSPYPSTLPDFVHAHRPHYPGYSPTGGEIDRPAIVIYQDFQDVRRPMNRNDAWMAQRMFGPAYPNVAGYFANESGGRFLLTAGAETAGTPNDGIVHVTVPMRAYDWRNPGPFASLPEADRGRRWHEWMTSWTLSLADEYIRFQDFDRSPRDGRLTSDELVILFVNTALPHPTDMGDTDACGGTRSYTEPGLRHDDVSLENIDYITASNTANGITLAHEVVHAALDQQRDWYFFGLGHFDVMSDTCWAPDQESWFGVNAWHEMHLGWTQPIVVTQDGYYDVTASGRPYLLYDPTDPDAGRREQNYFLVENRQKVPGTYDAGIDDGGLVAWRIDERTYSSTAPRDFPIARVRPCNVSYWDAGCPASDVGDAFDAGDPVTPHRSFTRAWRDGRPSNISVRAIPVSSGRMRAYFDVPGPGVLVDCYTPAPGYRSVGAGVDNTVYYEVRNTGETTDTFTFRLHLPAGWAGDTTVTRTLGPGEPADVFFRVRPPSSAAPGRHEIRLAGWSTTQSLVSSSCTGDLGISLSRTTIRYTGAAETRTGAPAEFRAVVTDVDNGNAPIADAPVTFVLDNGRGASASWLALTDTSGVATVSRRVELPRGLYHLRADVARHNFHDAARTATQYTVHGRPTELRYTGTTAIQYSDVGRLSAVVVDRETGEGVAGGTVDFAIAGGVVSAVTDASGTASTWFAQASGAAESVLEVSLRPTPFHDASHGVSPLRVEREGMTLSYTGDVLREAGSGVRLAVAGSQEADGASGDPRLADVHVALYGAMSGSTTERTYDLDEDGSAAESFGLAPDVYEVRLDVPANAYWAAEPARGELVVYDPARHLEGDVKDGTGTRLALDVAYVGAAPAGWVKVAWPGGVFEGSRFEWMTAAGSQGVLLVHGVWDGVPATMRLRVADGASGDWFAFAVSDGTRTMDSGRIHAGAGDLVVG